MAGPPLRAARASATCGCSSTTTTSSSGDFSRYDAWMAPAHARGDDVLLTINQHSSMSTRALPTLRAVPARRAQACGRATRGCGRWRPGTRRTTRSSRLFRKPRRAAQFYNIMREECRGCTIVAADVLDSSNMLPWLATFKRYAQHPRIWGLHSYDGHEPLQAAAGDVDAGAAARGPGRGLADGDGRHRPLRRPLPRRQAGERRAAAGGRRTFSVARDQPAREARLPLPLGRRPALPHVGLGLRARDGRRGRRSTCCGVSSTGSACGTPSRRSGGSRAIRGTSCRWADRGYSASRRGGPCPARTPAGRRRRSVAPAGVGTSSSAPTRRRATRTPGPRGRPAPPPSCSTCRQPVEDQRPLVELRPLPGLDASPRGQHAGDAEALSPVFTRPTNSWISFGLVPAASMVDGLSISSASAAA